MKLKNNLDKLVKTTEKVTPPPKNNNTSSPNPNGSNSIPSSNPRK